MFGVGWNPWQNNRLNNRQHFFGNRCIRFIFLLLASGTLKLAAQGTAFNYQGRLNDTGTPGNAVYDFRFAVYDAVTNGNQVSLPLTNSAVAVSNGLFSVTLDFGPGIFTGNNYWLDIEVRADGITNFTLLAPRQPVLPIPYAIYSAMAGIASRVSGTVPLTQLPAAVVTNGAAGVNLIGSFSGNGSGLTNLATSGTVTTNLPAGNGSNDTVMIQAVCATPFTYVKLKPLATYYVSNINVTNNVFIDGQGATVKFILGATNSMFDTGANNLNQSFIDLILDGQEEANYQSAGTLGIPPNHPEMYPNNEIIYVGQNNSSVTSRTGLRWNKGAGGLLRGCVFKGFSGIGLLIRSYYGTLQQYSAASVISDCVGSQNFISFYNSSGYWDGLPSYGASSYAPGSFAADSGEYCNLDNCYAVNSAIGFQWGAGNSMINGCYATACNVGLFLDSGPNSTHSMVTGLTVNHSSYGFVASSTSNEQMNNIITLANSNPDLVVNGQQAMLISDSTFGGTGILVSNTPTYPNNYTAVTIKNCFISMPIANSIKVCSSNCYAWFYGNTDGNGGDDGTLVNGMGTIVNPTGTGFGVIAYKTPKQLSSTLSTPSALVSYNIYTNTSISLKLPSAGRWIVSYGLSLTNVQGGGNYAVVHLDLGGTNYVYSFDNNSVDTNFHGSIQAAGYSTACPANGTEGNIYVGNSSSPTTWSGHGLISNSVPTTLTLATHCFSSTGTNVVTGGYITADPKQ